MSLLPSAHSIPIFCILDPSFLNLFAKALLLDNRNHRVLFEELHRLKFSVKKENGHSGESSVMPPPVDGDIQADWNKAQKKGVSLCIHCFVLRRE